MRPSSESLPHYNSPLRHRRSPSILTPQQPPTSAGCGRGRYAPSRVRSMPQWVLNPSPKKCFRPCLLKWKGFSIVSLWVYVSSDASDPDLVTPSVLLMGRPNGSLPQVVYPENELISRRWWKHLQVLADHFWARFIRLYVPSLQAHQKWQASPVDIVQDCVVMIADPQLPRALWPIGRVVKPQPSPDGHVRLADVKVRERVYTRPVARLVVLPALPSGEDEDNSTPTPSVQP